MLQIISPVVAGPGRGDHVLMLHDGEQKLQGEHAIVKPVAGLAFILSRVKTGNHSLVASLEEQERLGKERRGDK